jgi:hypothetical protein
VNTTGSSKLITSSLWGIFLFEFFCVVQSKLIHEGKYGKRMNISEKINFYLLHFITFLTSWLKQAADSQQSIA